MRKTILTAFITVLILAAAAWAQPANGTLTGKITNPQGAAVPNAAVTVTNVNTNTSQKVLTGPDGTFTVNTLSPGTYRVDVEIAGYKRTSQQNVTLVAGPNAPVTITLQQGSMNETVEIKGHSPSTQTEGGEVGMQLGTRTIRELPVQDRNHQELVNQQSGITPPPPALDVVRDPERNRFYSANGQDPNVNQWITEGLNNTEPFRGTAVRVIPNEAVQQMDIATANQTVEKGFNGGAWVADAVPSGTNGFHGDLFEFWSGDLLRVRNFFSPFNDNPHFVYNQFGGALSGPIAKDRTFFYGSYEGTYQNGLTTQVATVPTAGMLTGNFSGVPGLTVYNPFSGPAAGTGRTPFAGNRIPSSLINPFARTILSQFPTANQPGFVNNYVTNVPMGEHGNKLDGRIDQHFTDRTAAFVRYGYTNIWNYQASPLGDVIGNGTRGRLVGQNAVASVSHAFAGSLITDLRLGYNRYDQKLNAWGEPSSLAGMPGFGSSFNGANMIGINITGFSPIGAPSYVPEHPIDNTLDGQWSWGWVKGPNNFKFGADVRWIQSDGFRDSMLASMFGPNGTAFFGPGATLLNSPNGTPSPYAASYNSLAAFLLGAPSQVGISNFFVDPAIRQQEYSLWLGDHVRVFPRLTLDFGLRYEIYSPLEPAHSGGAAFFDPAGNTFNFAGIDNFAWHLQNYDLDAIAPRFGFAFRATDKTVIRGGYGLNYFQTPYMLSGFMAPYNGSVAGVQGGYTVAPFTGTFGATVNGTAAPRTLQNGAAAGNLPAAVLPTRLEQPYVQTVSLQIQQEFLWGTTLSAGYVGAFGRHLPYIENLNAAAPGAGVAGLPFAAMGRTAATYLFDNFLTNNYNSLQASLARRFQGGLSFNASYTFSKALGYTGSNGMLLNPLNLASNYGLMDYDRQHVLTISHLWEIPFGMHGNHIVGTILGGWQLNGMFTWATGTPLTVTADPVMCACPGNSAFANLVPGANPYLNQGIGYLNPAAFSMPALGTSGNLARGAFRGPDITNYDMSLFKNFHVHDRFNLQLRGEAYNLTNTPRFAAPVTNFNSPDFGQTTATINGAFGRQINVGARLLF